MPQPSKIPLAFAASGDKNTIPKSTETTGLASWRDGFPAITSAPFSEGGIAPKRADFNGIFNALSQAVMWLQQGGVYAYDVNTDYESGNVVLDAGGLYVANAANGPSSSVVQPSADTTGTTWKPVRLDLATQSAAGYMSAEDKALVDSIPALGTFNKMFFSQTSGSYTAPRTGVYRITLKGGGGGGGGAQTDRYATGGAGGEGGTIVFYETLTKNTSYAYTIGAGGAAGANGSDNTDTQNGTDGGTSSIVIGSTTYSITGGGGGQRRFSSGRGGFGGRIKTPSSNSVYMIPGTSGGNGTAISPESIAASGYLSTLVQGPGCSLQTVQSLYGGGGNGGGPVANTLTSTLSEPTAGGNGYILIEYAG